MGTVTRLLRGVWRTLGSTRLAAILMAALLLATLLASLFPQIPTEPAAHEPWLSAVYLRYRQATGLLYTLGLFDVYHAPWYLALLAALLLNTLVCTIQRLPRLWRSLTKPAIVTHPEPFYHAFARRSEWPVPTLEAGLAAAETILEKHRYHPQVERDPIGSSASLYAERGRWSLVGTLVSHLATMLLVIAVTTRPVLGWQETGVSLPPGQVYTLERKPHLAVRAGPLAVDRHPGGQPRDLHAPLAVLLDGTPVVSQTVRLNHPLTFQGVAFHLQGYGPAAQLATPEGTFGLAFAGSQTQEVTLPEAGLTFRVAYQPEGGALFVEALGADGAVLGSGVVAEGQEIEVQGTPITFGMGHYAIWQVSQNPTFVLAVGAAGLLLLGTVISLWVPHRRLWLRVDENSAQMVGAGDFAGDFWALSREIAHASLPAGGDNG